MRSVMKKHTRLHFSSISSFLILFSAITAHSQEQYICVWRNPEKTMTRIFPEANDYRTVNKRFGKEQRASIEKLLGSPLLPGQQDQFQYFEMLDSLGMVTGYTIASSQRGQFGAIEFVFGIDKKQRIQGIYIQRARERDKEFRSREFLDSFSGSNLNEIGKKEYEEMTEPMAAVILGIRKELITFAELMTEAQ